MENTLGAPTEGLGQTVTFAVNPSGQGSQASAAGPNSVRNTLHFGADMGVQRANHVGAVGEDKTLTSLLRLGETVLAPKIKEAKQAAYVEGMQRVAQGQAVTDLIEEQPWYSQVFGPTDLVEGARAYTASTKATEIHTSIEMGMSELRKMDGTSFAKHMQKQIEGTLTGDSGTDNMIQAQAYKDLPVRMAAQAKQHYVYNQEQFVGAQRSAMTAGLNMLGVLDAKARNGNGHAPNDAFMPGSTSEVTDGADVIIQAQGVLDLFRRPAGMDEKMHSRNVAEVLQTAGLSGNLAGLYAMQDAGIFSTLLPDHQQMALNAVEHAERKARANLPASMAISIADFRAEHPGKTREDVTTMAIKVNEEYTKLTGSRQPLFDAIAVASEFDQVDRANYAEARRLAHATEKAVGSAAKAAAKEQDKLQAQASMIAGGSVGDKPELAQEVFVSMSNEGHPLLFPTRVLQASTVLDKTFAEGMQRGIAFNIGKGDATKLNQVYTAQYLPLVTLDGNNGERAAALYAGPWARQMADYHQVMKAAGPNTDMGSMKELALAKVLEPQYEPNAKIDKVVAEAKATGKFMRGVSWALSLGGWGAQDSIAPGIADALAPVIGSYMKNTPSTMDPEARVSLATKAAQANGLEIAAGTFWHRPEKSSSISQGFIDADEQRRIPASEVHKALRLSMDMELKAVGLEQTGQIHQLADGSNGNVRFMLGGTDKEGNLRYVALRGEDIKTRWQAKRFSSEDADIAKMEDSLKVGRGVTSGSKFTPDEIKDYQDRINRKLVSTGRAPKY